MKEKKTNIMISDTPSFVRGVLVGVISFSLGRTLHTLIMIYSNNEVFIHNQMVNAFVSDPLFFIIGLTILFGYNYFQKNYEVKKKSVTFYKITDKGKESIKNKKVKK